MNLITIKTYDNAIGAHILQARLEDEGITTHIHDENIVTLDPLLNVAVGGIKIRVDEPDVEKALKIISEIEGSPIKNDKDEVVSCPNCESTELYTDFKSMKTAKGFFSGLTSVILGIFPLYFDRVYRCKKCDTEFKGSVKKK